MCDDITLWNGYSPPYGNLHLCNCFDDETQNCKYQLNWVYKSSLWIFPLFAFGGWDGTKEIQLIHLNYVNYDAQNLLKHGMILIEKEDKEDILEKAVDTWNKEKHSTR